MRENITALLMLYVRPVAAISRILDHGRLWSAVIMAVLVSVALHSSDLGALSMAEERESVKTPMARQALQKAAKDQPMPPEIEKMVKEAEDEADHPSPARIVGSRWRGLRHMTLRAFFRRSGRLRWCWFRRSSRCKR